MLRFLTFALLPSCTLAFSVLHTMPPPPLPSFLSLPLSPPTKSGPPPSISGLSLKVGNMRLAGGGAEAECTKATAKNVNARRRASVDGRASGRCTRHLPN